MLSRPLLADPGWAEKVRAGREDEVLPYISEAMTHFY